mmetsp:Transcript_25905/g.38785  ORF Transcript_25905/g.38785 Transcript_25905/m.38785 type:complete len:685 (-) Transcript_25905:99-2153(-)
MHLSHVCLASFLCSASSFTPNASIGSAVKFTSPSIRTNTGLRMSDDVDILWGGSPEGMPEKPPKAAPQDEDNPMGGQMFRKMMERAKQAGGQPPQSRYQGQQDQMMGQQQSPQLGQQIQPMQQTQQPMQMQQPPQYGAVPPPPQQQPMQMQQPMQQPQSQPGMDPYAIYQSQLQAWQQQMAAFAQFSAANPQAAAQMTMPPPPQPPMQQNFGGVPSQQQQPPQPQQQYQPPAAPAQSENQDPKSLNPYDYLPKGDGRNSQAYEVNNAADVYFAQLKRDSTIRTEARKAGDMETANSVFKDEGVKALSGLLSDELLAARRARLQESGGEFETSRDEMILPQHFVGSEDVDKAYTGSSYKEKLLNAKKKGGEGASAAAATAATTTTSFAPEVQQFDLASTAPNLATEQQQPEPQESQQAANFALPVKDETDIEEISAPSMEDSHETRQAIRTLMGLLLKHRGGPGFGHGRLVGDEAQKLEAAVPGILSLLNNEAGIVGTGTTASSAPPVEREQMSPLAGSVACIEAAVTMYKNTDAVGQSELIMPLRDALLSAVNTINKVVAEEDLTAQSSSSASSPPPSAVAPEPVYATTMDFPETYQVARPEEEDLQEIAEVIANSSTSSGAAVLSENTARLQKTLDSLKALTGNKKLGLRDVSKEEIASARDAINDMRSVLMDELEANVPTTA